MPDKHIVYISPGHMDPTYAIEREGLGQDVDLRVLTNQDRGFMNGTEAKDADAVMDLAHENRCGGDRPA
ncbi:MAG: hypothetical protein O3B65_07200 [Chloroflexi bacterium]|nr:hypothetical protein [Chloroflexota bacterium]